jgi:hypothetical protein
MLEQWLVHFHVCSRRAFWYIVYIVKAAHTKQKYEGAHTDTHHRPGVSHCLTLSHNVDFSINCLCNTMNMAFINVQHVHTYIYMLEQWLVWIRIRSRSYEVRPFLAQL